MTTQYAPFLSKLPNVGTTIFTVMSKMAAEYGAINLAQGFPDFPCDDKLIELVERALRTGYNQYAPMEGVLALRERIAEKTERNYGYAPDPLTDITVTSGATEALFAAIAAVVRPGDEVIVLEPCYDSYVPAIELNGGKVVSIPLRLEDYSIDWERVRAAISERTRLLMINSPHNPTAAVLSEADLRELRTLVRQSNVLILSDEVYEHIIFDGTPHRKHAKRPGVAAAQFCGLFVWKDLSYHWLENRVLHCPSLAYQGVSEGASIPHVLWLSPRTSGPSRVFDRPSTLRVLIRLLPSQARSVWRMDERDSFPHASQPRIVFPTGFLCAPER